MSDWRLKLMKIITDLEKRISALQQKLKENLIPRMEVQFDKHKVLEKRLEKIEWTEGKFSTRLIMENIKKINRRFIAMGEFQIEKRIEALEEKYKKMAEVLFIDD